MDKLLASPNWRAIKAGFQAFAEGICWGVGDENKIQLWSDCKIRGNSLRELIEGPLTQPENDLKLFEMILEQGQGWKWEILSFELPRCINDKIRAIPRYQVGRGEDIIIWKHSKDGEFTTKSGYALVNGPQEINTPFQGHWIWKTDTLPKIVNFL